MKMIIAIINNAKSEAVSDALLAANFRVTRLATTGSLLRDGSTTLMIGAERSLVEDVLAIIRSQIPPHAEKKQATLYVLNVKNFNRV
ncbi:MAG: cyclic-di-AMP receptor [Anaerolineales bacterium]|nr:cyclic-di-AMP receptor [Anaerolineales bacterium]